MRTYKIKSEEDLKKIETRNIEPILIKKVSDGWEIEVEEDVNVEEILKPVDIPSPEKKSEKKETSSESKSDKTSKKKKK